LEPSSEAYDSYLKTIKEYAA